ncbi:MAG TPA: phenylalanine--tRNA ligase subunit alpha, partial [Chroococcales cyanobacterium]
MKESIEAIREDALQTVSKTSSREELENLKIKYLGRKSELTNLLRGLGGLPPEERGAVGQLANATKAAIEQAIEEKMSGLSEERYDVIADREWIDVTAPGKEPKRGHLHPITQLQYEIEDIFRSMGFSIWSGPQVEDDYHNFGALNIPADHPARDMQDTFWLEGGNLLRTHT